MFLDKLKGYFRLRDAPEPIKPEYKSPRNEYYGRVSERFSTAQMILYVVLTVFVLISLMINSEWITYENFYYFFSDMGDYITAPDSEIEDVIYTSDRKQTFSMYGGKFAVAGNSGMRLYTASGRLIINDEDEIANPMLVSSDRYLLMYDHNGTEFRIYNIFTEVFSDNIDKLSIYGADIADSGDFALITSSTSNNFAVNLYSDKFKLEKIFKKNDYIVDIALDNSGSRLAMLSYCVEGGQMNANISMTRTNRDEPYADIELTGAMPLYCKFTDAGNLIVVCDNGIYSFTSNGSQITDLPYEKNMTTVLADVNSDGAAVVRKSGDSYALIVIGENGRVTHESELDVPAESIAVCGSSVFIDTDEKIIRLNTLTKAENEISFSHPDAVMLVKNESELLLCMSTKVRNINFDK
ncbi:MAG: hypothetical protein E7640_02655 [Ruminococcaceae bacterium]|nr:hypothetical protein [Oscillospiraceae bacterium]